MTRFEHNQRRLFQIRRQGVLQQWQFLAHVLHSVGATLPRVLTDADYETGPWKLLQDLNALSHEYLPRRVCFGEFENKIALAGFDVALQFDRVESASDFLDLIKAPDAERIYEFLHHFRLALQWAGVTSDIHKVESWLTVAEAAISRCPNWDSLNAASRFNCHEVMTGRFVKLAAALNRELRASLLSHLTEGTRDDQIEDIVYAQDRAVTAGVGEMTFDDLSDRIRGASERLGLSIAAVSILVTQDAISFVVRDSGSLTEPTTFHGSRTIPGIKNALLQIINHQEFDLDNANPEYLVNWPQDLFIFFEDALATIGYPILGRPSYIILSVNMPFQALPWQHLVAAASGFREDTPLVSIMPNFGVVLAAEHAWKSESTVRRQPELVCYPGLDVVPNDAAISDAVVPIKAQLLKFESNPRFSLGYIAAHGLANAGSNKNGINDYDIPNFVFGPSRKMQQTELQRALATEVLVLAICHAGAPGPTVLNDVGGALSPFLIEQRGILFAPIAEVSPRAATFLAERILRTPSRNTAMYAYSTALRAGANQFADAGSRECYLFNAYGLPEAGILNDPSLI